MDLNVGELSDLIEALEQVKLFDSLSQAELKRKLQAAREEAYAAGRFV